MSRRLTLKAGGAARDQEGGHGGHSGQETRTQQGDRPRSHRRGA
jgi:hypothetical protein